MKLIALFSFLITLSFLYGCKSSYSFTGNPDRTLEEPIVVNRSYEDTYQFIFHKKGNWTIYKSRDPEKLFENRPFLEFSGDTLEIKEGIPENERLYFGFVDDSSADTSVYVQSERLIALEGQPNFRDVGGIPTSDGRLVKWGHIYRSGDLHDITDRDLEYLGNLGIKTIIDFRNDIEVEDEPDRLPDGVNYVRSPIAQERGIEEYKKLKRQLVLHQIRGTEAKDRFKMFMEGFVDEAADDLKPVMQNLLDPDAVPLVYHCSGGKDRTGAMTSIILLALGVDEKTVKDEYLMSNFYRWELNQANIRRGRKVLIGKETLEYIFVVQEEYIDAVFEVINNKYGGISKYLVEKLGIDTEEQKKLIETYTYSLENLEVSVPDEHTVSELKGSTMKK